jgi:hypothetical protein
MKSFRFLAVGMILSLVSCQDATGPTTVSDLLHAPVTTNITNSFTYTIDANQYSNNSRSDLTFLSDSLFVTLSSSAYVSGQAIISLSDSANAIIFSDTVRSNKTIAIAGMKTTRPRHCNLSITNLTAKIAFVVLGR